MSKPFTDLRHRVDMIEQRERAPRPTGTNVLHEARIERMRKQMEHLELGTPTPARLGTIVANQSVVAFSTFSFDGSYPTGGEAISPPSVPGTTQIIMPGARGYNFTHDTGNILAWDSAGGEVPDATDLSLVTNVPYLAVGTVASERLAFRARGDMLLASVEVEVAEEFTGDTTDYWTLTLVRRTPGGDRLELGDPLVLQSRSLAANTLVTMYLPDKPLLLNDADTIHVEVAETGTPAYLSDLVVWVDARRRTA